jgi:hypothetical protein
LIVELTISKDVLGYGIIQVVSGLGQLIYTRIFPESNWVIFNYVSIAIGLVIILLGLKWRWGPFTRPLGITLLAVTYGVLGIPVLFASGLIYTFSIFIGVGVFLFAVLLFAVAWDLFKGKVWAWIAVFIITGLGLLFSIVVSWSSTRFSSLIEVYPLIPSVLGSAYLLWYLNRYHVASFFEESPIILGTSIRERPKALIVMTMILSLIAASLAYIYTYPPTIIVSSHTGTLAIIIDGTPGTVSGFLFHARKGDLLNYTFMNTEGSQVRFRIYGQYQSRPLISEIGVEGSGSCEVQSPQRYRVRVSIINSSYASVECEVRSTLYSMQGPAVQWLFLDICAIGLVTGLLLSHLLKRKLSKRSNVA